MRTEEFTERFKNCALLQEFDNYEEVYTNDYLKKIRNKTTGLRFNGNTIKLDKFIDGGQFTDYKINYYDSPENIFSLLLSLENNDILALYLTNPYLHKLGRIYNKILRQTLPEDIDINYYIRRGFFLQYKTFKENKEILEKACKFNYITELCIDLTNEYLEIKNK